MYQFQGNRWTQASLHARLWQLCAECGTMRDVTELLNERIHLESDPHVVLRVATKLRERISYEYRGWHSIDEIDSLRQAATQMNPDAISVVFTYCDGAGAIVAMHETSLGSVRRSLLEADSFASLVFLLSRGWSATRPLQRNQVRSAIQERIAEQEGLARAQGGQSVQIDESAQIDESDPAVVMVVDGPRGPTTYNYAGICEFYRDQYHNQPTDQVYNVVLMNSNGYVTHWVIYRGPWLFGLIANNDRDLLVLDLQSYALAVPEQLGMWVDRVFPRNNSLPPGHTASQRFPGYVSVDPAAALPPGHDPTMAHRLPDLTTPVAATNRRESRALQISDTADIPEPVAEPTEPDYGPGVIWHIPAALRTFDEHVLEFLGHQLLGVLNEARTSYQLGLHLVQRRMTSHEIQVERVRRRVQLTHNAPVDTHQLTMSVNDFRRPVATNTNCTVRPASTPAGEIDSSARGHAQLILTLTDALRFHRDAIFFHNQASPDWQLWMAPPPNDDLY